jgi:hypothetical protein
MLMSASNPDVTSALNHDRWDATLFRETRAAMPELVEAERALANFTTCHTEICHDVFIYLWQASPRLVDPVGLGPEHDQHWALIAGLDQLSAVDELRHFTTYDAYASGQGTLRVLEAMRMQLRDEQGDGQGMNVSLQPSAIAHALRPVVTQITERLRANATFLGALGVSSDALQHLEISRRAQLQARMDSAALRKFFDLVGRFRAAAAGAATRHADAREELVGITGSDRIADMIGAEHALRVHRVTKLEHLQRVAEGRLMTWEYMGEAPTTGGPLVVVVDESGSTNDSGADGVPRWVWIKAFTLGMLEVARQRSREAHVVSFGGPDQVEHFKFPAGQRDPLEVLAYAEHFFEGGTSYEGPLDLARAIVAEKPTADVILVTDESAGSVSRSWVQGWRSFREQSGLRSWGVAVDAAVAPVLRDLCDNVRSVTDLRSPTPVQDVLAM